MELGVVRGVRVLHRDLRAELHVRTDRGSEVRIRRHIDGVERGEIEIDESLALRFRDLQAPMDLNQVFEPADVATEPIGSSERLRRERGQMIDVLRLTRAEQRLQERIRQHRRIERGLQTVDAFVASCKFEQ
jgi:hypothetical protein